MAFFDDEQDLRGFSLEVGATVTSFCDKNWPSAAKPVAKRMIIQTKR
jgi:hypothetical protein